MSEYIITDEQIAENRRSQGRSLFIMPKIVRCRDCKFMFDWAYDVPMCKLWSQYKPNDKNAIYPIVKLDGFCAWGKKRDEVFDE